MLHEGQVAQDPRHARATPGGPYIHQLPFPLPDRPAQHARSSTPTAKVEADSDHVCMRLAFSPASRVYAACTDNVNSKEGGVIQPYYTAILPLVQVSIDCHSRT